MTWIRIRKNEYVFNFINLQYNVVNEIRIFDLDSVPAFKSLCDEKYEFDSRTYPAFKSPPCSRTFFHFPRLLSSSRVAARSRICADWAKGVGCVKGSLLFHVLN